MGANIKGESEDKRMKKIIDGKVYNTDTAKEIGEWSYGRYNDFDYLSETLYKTQKGAFFLYYEGGANTGYGQDLGSGNRCGGSGIRLISEKEAKDWCMEHIDADDYIEIFGEVEEG